MPRPKEIIDDEVALQAQRTLQQVPDFRVAIKLKAIVSSRTYPLKEVAEIFGIGRQSLRNWIIAFKKQGVMGLIDKPRGHRPSKLSADQWCEVGRWLEHAQSPDGHPCHWTLETLQHAIFVRWGIQLGITPVWRQVHIMGFTLKVPRPHHAKADAEQQAAFKKNC
jgi:transposase